MKQEEKKQISVLYRQTCLEPMSEVVHSYRLEAYVPGHECTSFDFWLSPNGKLMAASRTFYDLPQESYKDAILLGRELIKKL